jgi:ubiquitin-protein ligase E3 D
MDPIITVYAELLHNIRQLTISITLRSSCNPTTTLALSQDRKALVIEHQAQQVIAQLPGQVGADAILPRPLPRTKELVVRLSGAEDHHAWQPKRLGLDDHVIWPASSLTPDTRISCRACQSILLHGSVKVWKDLPSDSWAEMMDLWHCHKPDNEDSPRQDAPQSTKGYAAANSLASVPGCGLVHLDHFRVHHSDCRGLQVSRGVSVTASERNPHGMWDSRKRPISGLHRNW